MTPAPAVAAGTVAPAVAAGTVAAGASLGALAAVDAPDADGVRGPCRGAAAAATRQLAARDSA